MEQDFTVSLQASSWTGAITSAHIPSVTWQSSKPLDREVCSLWGWGVGREHLYHNLS